MLKKKSLERIITEERDVHFIYHTLLGIRKRCQPDRAWFKFYCTTTVAENYHFWSPEQRIQSREEDAELEKLLFEN
jgi:hypothetical protein